MCQRCRYRRLEKLYVVSSKTVQRHESSRTGCFTTGSRFRVFGVNTVKSNVVRYICFALVLFLVAKAAPARAQFRVQGGLIGKWTEEVGGDSYGPHPAAGPSNSPEAAGTVWTVPTAVQALPNGPDFSRSAALFNTNPQRAPLQSVPESVMPAAHSYSGPVFADPGGYGFDRPSATGYPDGYLECSNYGSASYGGPWTYDGGVPMGTGYLGLDQDGCCRPRWFDIYVGPVILQRDLAVNRVQTTSDGLGAGNIVLSTDDLSLDWATGGQITVARLIGVGRSFESNIVGLVEWSAFANVTSPIDNLYSVFSEFGQNPGPPGPEGGPGPGFLDTDQAAEHSIDYRSRFHSFELIVRQRSTTPGCRIHLSHTAGIRYISLGEDFLHRTNVAEHNDPFSDSINPIVRSPSSLAYEVQTENDLLGGQLGASAEVCLVPRFHIGGEAKVGLYQNFAEQKTRVICTSYGDSVFHEHEIAEELAGVLEASFYAIFQVNSRLALRFGCQMLYMDRLALAPEQFNATPFNILPPPPGVNRVPFIRNDADLFIHGFIAGGEWTW